MEFVTRRPWRNDCCGNGIFIELRFPIFSFEIEPPLEEFRKTKFIHEFLVLNLNFSSHCVDHKPVTNDETNSPQNLKRSDPPDSLSLSLWKSHGIPFHEGLTVHYRSWTRNSLLSLEREREESEFEKSFSANGSRPCSFRLEGAGAPLPLENTSFPPLYFHEHVPGGDDPRLTDPSCVSCTSIPSSSFGWIEEHPCFWCKRSCRIESTPSDREKVVSGRGGRFLRVEKVGRATGDDPSHTHTYPDFRVLVRRARPSVATNALSWHSL